MPPFVLLEVQAEKFPLSNPSAKIRSDRAGVGEGVKVFVGVNVGPGVLVSVGVLLGVKVAVSVGVYVAVGDGPMVGVDVSVKVAVCVGVSVEVAVLVGVAVEKVPDSSKLKASTSLASSPHVLPSK